MIGCFSLAWLEQLLIWLVILCAVIAILKILIPWVLSIAGIQPPPPLIAVLDIIIWAIVAIAVIIFVFSLISCLIGGGGLKLLPPR